MAEVRVALAAQTILYTPIYLIAQRGWLHGHTLQIHRSKGAMGDEEAYSRLARDAEICIADPMACLPLSAEGQVRKSAVVASLLHKPGLWGVATCYNAQQLTMRDSPFLASKSEAEQRISSVVTYSTASTAGRIAEHIKKERKHSFSVKDVPFGTELNFVRAPTEDGGYAHLVLTCDLVGALAVERERTSIRALTSGAKSTPGLVSHFHKDEDFWNEYFFTSVIASPQMMAEDNRAVLKAFLRALQGAIDWFYGATDPEILDLAQELNADDELFPSVGEDPTCAVQLETKARLPLVADALHYMRHNRLLDRQLRPSPLAWSRSYEVWTGKSDSQGREFQRYVQLSFVRSASPAPVVARLRSGVRTCAPFVAQTAGIWVLLATIASQVNISGVAASLGLLGVALVATVIVHSFQEIILD